MIPLLSFLLEDETIAKGLLLALLNLSELKKLIVERLKFVLADEKLFRQMENEEDLENEITEILQKKEKTIEEIKKNNEAI